jgi:hypothetical protein
MSTADNHFGHRESDGIVVDLFWEYRSLDDEFRVEVEDMREGARFVLYPTTGSEAIQAFYHPFSAARAVLRGKAWAHALGVSLQCSAVSSFRTRLPGRSRPRSGKRRRWAADRSRRISMLLLGLGGRRWKALTPPFASPVLT